MSPELALTELRGGLITVLWVAGPLLLTVLVVGVVVGVVQAATQLNEPTIAFVAKAAADRGAVRAGQPADRPPG
jgi:flagellar biosynthetic protein FliQ